MQHKKIISLILFILHSVSYGHGFGPSTLVQLPNESQETIHTLCLQSLRNTIAVASCDIPNSCLSNQCIKIGKRSKTNCYIKLGFGKQFNVTDDIICTPTQEFYVPAYRKWLPAYMLKPGDALLTYHLTVQPITFKEFVPKSHKVYMLEVEQTHTFFVGKHSILTHNMFLPMAMSLGASIPFGSVVAGSIGSFFGTAAVAAGFTFGGVVGVAVKALYDSRVHHYKLPQYDINRYYNIQNERASVQPHGCFESHIKPEHPSQHIFSIEYPSAQTPTGCIEIDVHALGTNYTCSYDKTIEQQKIAEHGCFQPNDQIKQSSSSSQEKPSVKEKPKLNDRKKDDCEEKKQYNGPWYNRTEDWINEHQFGQKIKKSLERSQYTNQGKRAFKVIKDIENCDGFKKGDYVVVDAMHRDHLEVFGKDKKWKSVANFDGSKNIEKTKQGMKELRRPLEGS